MLKHRGFPGRLPGTDHQFVIRRANPKGATRLVARERFRDRSPAPCRREDATFPCAAGSAGRPAAVFQRLAAARYSPRRASSRLAMSAGSGLSKRMV